MFYEGDALAVHGIQQVVSFLFGFAQGQDSAKLFGSASVQKNMKCVGVLP
jgi:hypothetical protein